MELKDHFASLQPRETAYLMDINIGLMQLVMDSSRKYNTYSALVVFLVSNIYGRNHPDDDPVVYNEALKSLIAHALEECPNVRTELEARLKEDFPELVSVFLPELPDSKQDPCMGHEVC